MRDTWTVILSILAILAAIAGFSFAYLAWGGDVWLVSIGWLSGLLSSLAIMAIARKLP
jgi:hypothetical protein